VGTVLRAMALYSHNVDYEESASGFLVQARRYVDGARGCLAVAPNLLALLGVFGIIAQFFGGLIFFVYFLSVGFMPDMDLQTSFLIVAALTGSFVIVVLAFSLVGPGFLFGLHLQDEKFSIWDIVLWFVFPISILFVLDFYC
jgi:hypothetical protein